MTTNLQFAADALVDKTIKDAWQEFEAECWPIPSNQTKVIEAAFKNGFVRGMKEGILMTKQLPWEEPAFAGGKEDK